MNTPSDLISPLILTYNEAPNIGRTLERLAWAKQIVIVDSFSTDETLNIVRLYPQVRLLQRPFDSHANQWNFGLDHVSTPWVLALDADYIVPDGFIQEVSEFSLLSGPDGYVARFRYSVHGKPLRGTLYPPGIVLFRRDRARYYDDGHTQRLKLDGEIGQLQSKIVHDDRKSFSCWLQSQDRYMILEAQKLMGTAHQNLSLASRIRKTKVLAPLFVMSYCLFAKRTVLDGWPGWYYTLQRVAAEIILSLRLIEAEKLQTSEQTSKE